VAADAVPQDALEAVGKLLRETRTSQGLAVSDVARVLRISQKYLEALEEGRNEDLPGSTYAIGFIRSYAEHLKLDGEEIVRRYKDQDTGLGLKSKLHFPKPIPEGGVPGAAVLGLGVMIVLVAYGVWYWNSNNDGDSVATVDAVPEHLVVKNEDAAKPAVEQVQATPEVDPVAQDIAPVVEEAAVEIVTPEPAPANAGTDKVDDQVEDVVVETVVEAPAKAEAPVVEAPVVEALGEAPVDAPVVEAPVETPEVKTPVVDKPVVKAPSASGASRVVVRAKANSWIQIRDHVANRLLFTRLLREGDEYEVPNRAGLRLMTGNAGALDVLVDGKVVPSIGDVGVVRRDVDLDPDKLKSGAAVTD
jgi:cytoskeleton protein RodZ